MNSCDPIYTLRQISNQMTTQQFLHRLFSKYDNNGDGRLSIFQFSQLLKHLTKVTGASYPKRPDVEDIFSYLDKDGDKTISREQFTQITQSLQALIFKMGVKFSYRST